MTSAEWETLRPCQIGKWGGSILRLAPGWVGCFGAGIVVYVIGPRRGGRYKAALAWPEVERCGNVRREFMIATPGAWDIVRA